MTSDTTTDEYLNHIANLIVLGILINAYYYFGFGGAIVALILAALLEPISSADLLGTSADEED